MIRFRRNALWGKVILYWWGGVNQHILRPCLVYLIFLIVLYKVQAWAEICVTLTRANMQIFGSFLVFLLVFRLNQCMARFKQGKDLATQLFATSENLVYAVMMSLVGADKFPDARAVGMQAAKEHMSKRECAQMALVTKLNCVRLVVALALSFVMHCRLLEGASDSDGELDDKSVKDIVFLYCRLQALLYAEEMEVVDNAICVYASQTADRRIFRAETNRHRLRGIHHGESIFGQEDKWLRSIWSTSGTVVPLPKVIAMMLMDCLMRPLDAPWGYAQRMLNIVVDHIEQILFLAYDLETLINIPLPLAYLQHCRVLLAIFAFCHPFSIDPAEGTMNNIVMPFFLFWAMMGFEELAAMLENPLGADETDLNLLGMVHSLEVACSSAFDMSNKLRPSYRKAQLRPFQDFNLDVDVAKLHEDDIDEAELGVNHSFSHYFHWLPMPSLVLENVFESHGHVDTVHAAKGREMMGHNDLRALIRKSVLRSWRPHRQSFQSDGRYEAVPTRDDTLLEPTLQENGGVGYSSSHTAWDDSSTQTREGSRQTSQELSEGDKDTLKMLQDDPNVFSDYLVFEGVLKQKPHEVGRHNIWNERAASLLGDHSASSLILKTRDQDTDRSTMGLETAQRFMNVIKGHRHRHGSQHTPTTQAQRRNSKRASKHNSGMHEIQRDSRKRLSGKLKHPIVIIRPRKEEPDDDDEDEDDDYHTSGSETFDTGAASQGDAAERTSEAIAQRMNSRASGATAPCPGVNGTCDSVLGHLADDAISGGNPASRELTTNSGVDAHSVGTGATTRSVSERDPLLSSLSPDRIDGMR